MHLSERWESDQPGDRLLLTALTPLSWLYAAGWQAYLGVYRLGLKRAKEPHAPVICIGNLVSGGSGKSPVTLEVARILRSQGREVVVSCSGYGSPSAAAAQLAPEGPLDARKWGDEPAMIRWLAPELPLIVGRRRVLAAELCARHYPQAVMLMDDGFQHLPLRKHLSIVLDPTDPKNRRCLPAGPYREPRGNRRRADTVLPGEYRVVPEPLSFVTADGQETPAPAEASALCALGRPQGFLAAAESAGVRLAARRLLPDHDPLNAGTLFDSLPEGLPVIVTAKDWVKLRERTDASRHSILIARHRVRIEPEEAFASWLAKRLDEFTQERV